MTLSSQSTNNRPNRRQFFGFAASGVALVALTACAGPQARVTEYHYGLTPQLNALSLPKGQIKIERISANGIFAGRPIIEQVSTTPERYVETRSKLWRSSPSDLIRDALIKGWNKASDRKVITSSLSATISSRSFSPKIRFSFKLPNPPFKKTAETNAFSARLNGAIML